MATGFSIVTACETCGTKNRVSARHLADVGKCGACKAALPPTNHPIDVDQSGFDEILSSAKVPILVDFWAEWCGPCKMAAPEVKKLAAEMSGRALVVKVDTESQPALSARYRIQGIPNFMVFRNGQPVFQQAGATSSAQMRKWLEQAGA
jgi:thioredoxin 2